MTHTVTHMRRGPETKKDHRAGTSATVVFAFARFLGYITWDIKLPMASAAASWACRVAWV